MISLSNNQTSFDPFTHISTYYDDLVERFGYGYQACDYGREESQLVKFRVLASAVDYSNRAVLDVGCGFADFARYLQTRFRNTHYTGLDLSPAMIECARRNNPTLDLRLKNVLDITDEQFDVVTANGIFYLLGREGRVMMRSMIEHMFNLSREVLAFNSLSSWCIDQESNEFYADPIETLTFCRSLSPLVVFRHDYHSRDFTIYLYRKLGLT